MVDIPRSEAMLAQSTSISVVIPITLKVSKTEIMYPLTAEIGTIQKLTRSNTIQRNRRYSLGKHALEPIDILPGPITSSITVSKVVLYKDTYKIPFSDQLKQYGLSMDDIANVTSAMETNGELQGLFGITGGNVLYQQKPIHIQVINYDHSSNDSKVCSMTYYWNCWFRSNPINLDVSASNADNIMITQDVELDVGRIQSFEPNLSRVLSSSIASLIPSSITL